MLRLTGERIGPTDNSSIPPASFRTYHERLIHNPFRGLSVPVPLQDFLTRLKDSGLLSAEEIAQSSARFQTASAGDDPVAALARDLVQRGRLTKYQAQCVWQGKQQSLVLGNYIILDELGAGGMGQVFKAAHRRMKRTVALKVLSPKLTASADSLERFQREVEAAARLSHPNIVTAHDADEAKGTHFLVMEFVPGSDLATVVQQHGPLDVERAISYLLQAARGLEYAHQQGIVHRDIKPANLLCNQQGQVKILDMGLARFSAAAAGDAATQAHLTQDGTVMGTVDYMAPEQATDSHAADARADQYSLGCTLHYLLTGRPVYGGSTLTARLLAHQTQPVPSLAAARPDVPAALDAAFQKMLSKRPAERYGSMTEVIAALSPLASAAGERGASAPCSVNTAKPPAIAGASHSERTPSAGATERQQAAYAPRSPTATIAYDAAASPATASVSNSGQFDTINQPTAGERGASAPCSVNTADPAAITADPAAITGAATDIPAASAVPLINEPAADATERQQGAYAPRSPGAARRWLIAPAVGLCGLVLVVGIAYRLAGRRQTADQQKRPIVVAPDEGGVPASADPDRAAAEWKGWIQPQPITLTLRDRATGTSRAITAGQPLPDEPFDLIAVWAEGADEIDVPGMLAILAPLRSLYSLVFPNCRKINDTVAAAICAHPRLRSVALQGTAVTADGWLKILDVPTVTAITLDGGQFTSAVRDRCAEAKRVTVIDLRDGRDEQLSWLQAMSLSQIMFADSSAEVSTYQQFSRMCLHLEVISLAGSNVTTEGLQGLVGMERLESLSIRNTAVDDGAIDSLATLQTLQSLDVSATKFTADGVQKLRAALPRCRIVSDHGTFEPTEPGQPVTPSLPTAGESPPRAEADQQQRERAAAEWALSVGAAVQVQLLGIQPNEDQHMNLQPGDPLPQRPFLVISLGLNGRPIGDDDLARLTDLAWLRNLHVSVTPIGDAGLRHLGRCRNLVTLHIEQTEATDAGLDHLAGLRDLQHLHATETQVTPAAFDRLLDQLPHFNVTPLAADSPQPDLRVAQAVFDRGGWVGVNVWDPPLRQGLSATVQQSAIAEVRALDQLPQRPWRIHTVVIQQAEGQPPSAVDEAFILDCARLEWLVTFHVDSSVLRWTERGLDALAAAPRLRHFSAQHSSLDDAGLRRLTATKQDWLQLVLGQTQVTNAGLAHLAGQTDLQMLILAGCSIDDDGLTHLAELTRLNGLALDLTQVRGPGLAHVAGLPRLTTLSLRGTPIDNDALTHIGRCRNLRTLTLNETNISDAGLPALHELSQLRSLDLRSTPVTPSGLTSLRAALPQCQILSDHGTFEPAAPAEAPAAADLERDVAKWALSVGAAVHLQHSLSEIAAVQPGEELPQRPFEIIGLDFRNNTRVTDDDLARLPPLRRLATLHLGNTPITDAELQHVARCRQLAVLGLPGNAVTDDGLLQLADLPELQKLDAGETQVTPQGFAKLLAMLPKFNVRQPPAGEPGPDERLARWALEQGGGTVNVHVWKTIADEPLYAHVDVTTKIVLTRAEDLPQGVWRLQALDIQTVPNVSPERLQQAGELEWLSSLTTDGAQVSDDALTALAQAPRLRRLVLQRSDLTDDGLKLLAAKKDWLDLYLYATQITGAGLAHLADQTALGALAIGGTPIADEDLVHLAGLRELEQLSIISTAIRGTGLAHLHGLPRLRELAVSHNRQLDDTALPHLRLLRSLQLLDLEQTSLTPAALATLQADLPGCKIKKP